MDFFEKYEVRTMSLCQVHFECTFMQAKVAELDSRLSSVAQDKVKTKEQIAVLQANADKLNPNKTVTSTKHCR